MAARAALTARPDRVAPAAARAVNEVRLVGRLAAPPEERVLPSGDAIATFRLIVDRPPRSGTGARVDTVDCAVFGGGLRRRCLRWAAGDVLEVQGSLRRRFFRTGGGPASRYEVEVAAATRVNRAPG